MNRILLSIGAVAIIVVLGVVGYSHFAKKTTPLISTKDITIKSSDATCADIAKIDFKNTVIEDGQFGTLQFKNGIFESKEDPENKGADWEHNITEDFILRPESSQTIRFININSSHLTGSGAWDSLIGFKCVDGNINKVFDQKRLYGIKVEKFGEKQFSLTVNDWVKSDPTCCPSQEKVSIFQWNSKDQIFSLESEKVQKVQP